ncbi:MAG: hypothetical protein H6621_02885 [Halobacteriovoraceae bacterium]|nr:hypothetical protein [Halobacteriovoraceae bacterium]MCB9093990.1 hypothetical protein [Halobacteriovoraceae bacterium]
MKRILFALFLMLFACTKDEFTKTTKSGSGSSKPIKKSIEEKCSNFSPPPVDILLLLDNSSSTNFLQVNLKEAITSIANAASDFFDYRIYIAPLIPYTVETEDVKRSYQVITNVPSNLPISVHQVGINQLQGPPKVNYNGEKGFARAYDMLYANSEVGGQLPYPLFRNKAYTMVILISNGDDNDLWFTDNQGNKSDGGSFEGNKAKLLNLKSQMNAHNLRFITVVNHSTCGSTVRDPGERYKAMSNQIYIAQPITDDKTSTPDSYDLCKESFGDIFVNIAETIKQFNRGHIYKYWPLGDKLDFDPDKLIVKKKISGETLKRDDASQGYTFLPDFTTLNIREYPPVSSGIPAENYTGYFIELHNSAKVTYPECLIVTKEDFTKYYGYITIEDEPLENSIQVVINDKEIPQDKTNGWEYIGYKESVNLLVKSPANPASANPGIFRTGYVIKLNGSAIYTDGTKATVYYKGAPLN